MVLEIFAEEEHLGLGSKGWIDFYTVRAILDSNNSSCQDLCGNIGWSDGGNKAANSSYVQAARGHICVGEG